MGALVPSFLSRKRKSKPFREKPRYAIWQGLWMSCYSADFYLDVLRRWRGFGIRYFFLVSLIVSSPFAIQKTIDTIRHYDDNLIVATSRMPDIQIVNGKVKFDKPMPYVIYDNFHDRPLVVVDTTRPFEDFESHLKKGYLVITGDRIRIAPKPGTLKLYSDEDARKSGLDGRFQKNDNGFITKDTMEEMARRNRDMFLYATYPALVSAVFSAGVFVLSILSHLAAFFCRAIFRCRLSFAESVRLGMVASTPQFIVLLLTSRLPWSDASKSAVLFSLFLCYFCFGAMLHKHRAQQLVATS